MEMEKVKKVLKKVKKGLPSAGTGNLFCQK
jgi:hypothetical protein